MPRDKTGHFYFSFYPTIFKQDTQRLTLAEDGAYRRLIDEYMVTRAPLPSDDRSLARIVGVGVEEWLSIKTQLVSYFKPVGSFLRHSFCDDILSADLNRIKNARDNGAKGGRPRGSKSRTNTQSVSPEEPSHNPAGFPNTTLNNSEQDSEGKPSGEVPPVDFKKTIFTEGLLFLEAATGKTSQQLRPLLGKWCKARGDPAVAGALIKAQQFAAVDPIAYIEHFFKENPDGTRRYTPASPPPTKTERAKAALLASAQELGYAPDAGQRGQADPHESHLSVFQRA